jgi:alpha-1,3-glucosyltransferase
MRATVLASEYLVYIPAAVVVVRRLARIEAVNHWESSIALVAILMQPSTLLIDHGHFQYNTVMLGLSLATISSMLAGNLRWACVFFVGALGFKQMALFYAPAVFAYLLSLCVTPRINFTRFISIGLVTVLAFGLLFAPLLLGAMYDSYRGISVDEYEEPPLLSKTPIHLDHKAFLHSPIVQLAQSIHRIFPFARGLFEDKVANAWCALHTVHKLNKYQSSLVQRAALLATTSAIIPPCLILFLKPRKELLPLAFASTAWGFFLFSYQVHEKNILLPLMPMTFLLATHDGLLPYTRAWVGFANTLASWTLYPLLRRDGLQVPFFVLTLLWAFILGLPPVSFAAYVQGDSPGRIGILTTVFHIALYLAMVGWHFVYAFVPPPVSKPDLWVVANVIIGAGGFGVCYLWCLYTLAHKAGYYGAVVPQKKIQ